MAKCPICKNKDANKKNVHLIPWFLIKNCVTEKGTGVRDMELSFTIDPSRFTKMYTGRSILPENVVEFGALHDLQKESENPYSIDNLVCNECEEKFSRLEAIFAFQFSEKKVRSAYQSKLEIINGHSVLIDLKYNNTLYDLLIQSIFYRCSIGRFNGFSLNSNMENKIEENLREAFSTGNFKKLTASDRINFPHIFPIVTSSLFIPEGQDPTQNFIVVNQSRFPYFLMAGKWIFQLYEREKHLKSSVEWFYGLKENLDVVEAYSTVKESAHVILLEEKVGKSISDNLLNYITEKRLTGLRKNIRDLHQHIFKHKPDAYIAQYIFRQYFIHLDQGKTEFDSMVNAFFGLKKMPKKSRFL